MFKEFKEFAMKGNLIDMAVAFVMGAAFAVACSTRNTSDRNGRLWRTPKKG